MIIIIEIVTIMSMKVFIITVFTAVKFSLMAIKNVIFKITISPNNDFSEMATATMQLN